MDLMRQSAVSEDVHATDTPQVGLIVARVMLERQRRRLVAVREEVAARGATPRLLLLERGVLEEVRTWKAAVALAACRGRG